LSLLCFSHLRALQDEKSQEGCGEWEEAAAKVTEEEEPEVEDEVAAEVAVVEKKSG